MARRGHLTGTRHTTVSRLVAAVVAELRRRLPESQRTDVPS